MNDFYCRYEETRIRLVEKYDIVPSSRLPLLKGQTKHSATGDIIKREYYCFSYKSKNSNEEYETFIVGSCAAKHFLKLLNHTPLQMFDIFESHKEKLNKRKNQTTLIGKEKWNPLAKELYRVINIILMAWDTNGRTLSKILQEINNNQTREPPPSLIKSVNTIISKDSKNRTIYEMLDEFRKENRIKDFKFPLITEVLKGLLEKNYIDQNYITGTKNEQ
jgi:hypothetical protein